MNAPGLATATCRPGGEMAVPLYRFMERLCSSPQGGVDVVVRPPTAVGAVSRRGIPDEYLEKRPSPAERDADVLVAQRPLATWTPDPRAQPLPIRQPAPTRDGRTEA